LATGNHQHMANSHSPGIIIQIVLFQISVNPLVTQKLRHKSDSTTMLNSRPTPMLDREHLELCVDIDTLSNTTKYAEST
jgi:hypothetical protein